MRIMRIQSTILSGILLVLATGCAQPRERVIVYSAQDPEFADELFRTFSERTGIATDAKYDTEANKSVSLYAELVNEKDRPRCDVWWNNEILGTIRLDRQGMLEPYASAAAEGYPASSHSANHTWQAFASRPRVLIVNTDLVAKKDWPTSILDLTQPKWKNVVALAKPQFGTTATQAACLFEVLGPAKAKVFYLGLKNNGVHIVAGNKQVAQGVSSGQFAMGMTDGDDAIIEVEAKRPVEIIFPDADRPKSDRMGTLFIPNTLAAIKGAPHDAAAHRLVDYLLSPEVEEKLAMAQSHQFPMNPKANGKLPSQFRKNAKSMDVNFEKAADLWDETQKFLRDEFAR
jgi:iron(III) transport system substrate-binding protein